MMKKILKIFTIMTLTLLAFFAVYFALSSKAPKNFPVNEIIEIERGDSIVKISNYLKKSNLIHSTTLFKLITTIFKNNYTAKAGHYKFEKPATLFGIIDSLQIGDFGDVHEHVTIPEGSTNKQVAEIFSKNIENFDSSKFLNLVNGKEGYLFPDTYFLLPSSIEEEIIEIMSNTFQDKIKDLDMEIKNSKESFEEIIIMASIIEKETNGNKYREANIISGILWKRIENGIPLQVDAPFLYLLGKESSKLTKSDLRIDSPFNTYLYKGLPPSPIGNPGLKSIMAALTPEKSPYFFYLHDNNGNIHYSIDHNGHVRNKNIYLK